MRWTWMPSLSFKRYESVNLQTHTHTHLCNDAISLINSPALFPVPCCQEVSGQDHCLTTSAQHHLHISDVGQLQVVLVDLIGGLTREVAYHTAGSQTLPCQTQFPGRSSSRNWQCWALLEFCRQGLLLWSAQRKKRLTCGQTAWHISYTGHRSSHWPVPPWLVPVFSLAISWVPHCCVRHQTWQTEPRSHCETWVLSVLLHTVYTVQNGEKENKTMRNWFNPVQSPISTTSYLLVSHASSFWEANFPRQGVIHLLCLLSLGPGPLQPWEHPPLTRQVNQTNALVSSAQKKNNGISVVEALKSAVQSFQGPGTHCVLILISLYVLPYRHINISPLPHGRKGSWGFLQELQGVWTVTAHDRGIHGSAKNPPSQSLFCEKHLQTQLIF